VVVLLLAVAVEEAVVLALPLFVLQPPLQLGDGWVEGRRVVVLRPVSSGFVNGSRSVGRSHSGGVLWVELEAAVGTAAVGLEAGRVRCQEYEEE